jgi:hypothetical protein
VHPPCRITPTFSGNNAGSDIAAFFIPQAVLPGIVGRMFIRPYTWNWGMDGPGKAV